MPTWASPHSRTGCSLWSAGSSVEPLGGCTWSSTKLPKDDLGKGQKVKIQRGWVKHRYLSTNLVMSSTSLPTEHTSTSAASDRSLLPSHYSSYDLICCIEDPPTPPNSVGIVTATFFTSCIVISLVGGFGLNLAFNSKKYMEPLRSHNDQSKRPGHVGGANGSKVVLEDPMILATRALGWGSLFAILGSGTIGLTAVCFWKLWVWKGGNLCNYGVIFKFAGFRI